MPAESDQQIALGFAPNVVRRAFTTLLQLDARLAQIVMQTREVTLGKIKLQWWHDQLSAINVTIQAADPLITDVFDAFHHHDVTFETVARLTLGWNLLLEPLPLDREHLSQYAFERGATLFEIGGQIAGHGSSEALRAAGAGWALIDLAFRCSDRKTALSAQSLARDLFGSKPERKLGRDLRPFALLAHFSAIDAQSGIDQVKQDSAPRRAFEALKFSLFR